MKLNDIDVTPQQMSVEQVDGVFIVHDPVSKKVIQFNETSSFVWKIILEHERTGDDLETSHIVHKILEVYDVSEGRKQDVCQDTEEILQSFFDVGLLQVEIGTTTTGRRSLV